MVLEAYPSIFSDKVIIAYSLDEPADVSIEVVDIVGRTVRRLIGAQRRSSGDHTITWDGYGGAGPSLASGMYWVVMSGSGQRTAWPVVLRR